ncbi:SdrD B-like domain-containing protein [Pseudomaricurvus hydrocarbonicus]
MGFCEFDPVAGTGADLQAEVRAADGISVLRTLSAGTDYVVDWGGTTGPDRCTLSFEMTDAGGALLTGEHLVIDFVTQLDSFPLTSPPSGDLTNIAAATSWYNADSSVSGRLEISRTLTNGTPTTTDHEDNEVVTVALSGFYFEKTVENLATGSYPAVTAVPGEQLRYSIRLFNVDENITDIRISDPLTTVASQFSALPTSADIVTCEIRPANAGITQPACSFSGGQLQVVGQGGASLDLPVFHDLVIEFDATLATIGLANGDTVSNQAILEATGITSVTPVPASYPSDDPFVNGVADPTVAGDEDPTVVTIIVPDALDKQNPATTDVVIGETFDYTLTVPATPVAAPLYDVSIVDSLPDNLEFISASALVGATSLTLRDTDNGANNDLVLIETSNAFDIPAGETATVTITVRVRNDGTQNQEGETFFNTASYTYARSNGGAQLNGGSDTTELMTVREPQLEALPKTVTNITLGGNSPAATGHTLEYVVSWENSGSVTAYDVNVTDFLPATLTLDTSFTPLATIGGDDRADDGFVATPLEPGDGSLIWGRINGDNTLDVPVGQTLTITYRVIVSSPSTTALINSVWADWTSLNNTATDERTGAGCPSFLAPDDYCSEESTSSLDFTDGTAFSKTIVADSWDDGGVITTATDGILRVGDKVDFALTATLREGPTASVVVTDTLPAGLEFDSVIAINGNASAPYSSVAPFTHANIGAPAVAGNVITWNIGAITNAVDNNSANDTFEIHYRARVVNSTLTQADSTVLTNAASLSYDSGMVLDSSVDIDVRQPVVAAVSKVDGLGNSYPDSTAPLSVDIATGVMSFELHTCNAPAPAAPAYNVQLVDTLAAELDETSVAIQQVTINGATATDGADYTYTPPAARGGDMTFDLLVPLAADECATINYDVGFHTDVAPNQLWANSVAASEYWSLPTPTTDGEQYAVVGPAEFWMTNTTADPLPVKTVVAPIAPDTDVTIGETVTYAITIPAINAVRNDLQVTDSLPAALVYVNATATVGGTATALTDNTSGQNVDLILAQVPAGEEVVITLNSYVANSAATNAGDVIDNTASYSYSGYTGAVLTSAAAPTLTIVEPTLGISKDVANITSGKTATDPAAGGDLLEYTVTVSNSGNATAFDSSVTDTLPAGLALVAGSATATINGTAVSGFVASPTVAGNDLLWGNANSDATLDIPAGQSLVLTYQVNVTDASAGTLDNSAMADASSLDGVNARERFGDNCPTPVDQNDYCAGPAVASVTTLDTTALAKTVIADSWDDSFSAANDGVLRVGDTVDFQLTLTLREGLTTALTLSDTLPAGLEFDSVLAINSDTSAPYSNAVPFSHTDIAAPSVAGNVITWSLGDISNAIDNNTANDTFVIQYRARVAKDILSQTDSLPLTNAATLNYDAGSVRNASANIEVRQPVISAVTKIDGLGDSYPNPAAPLIVDIINDTVSFELQSCNAALPAAPAYNLQLVDTLASELDEGSIANLQVTINGAAASNNVEYNYTAPAGRGGSMTFDLLEPLAPGQCVTVNYDIGFYADVLSNQYWVNSVAATDYWSLPTPTSVGEQYALAAPAEFWMSNAGSDPLPVKTLVSPLAEVAVGETVTYEIEIPAVSALRNAVVITDTLPSALSYDSASATVAGAPAALTDNTSGQDVNLTLAQIPAGEVAVITLITHVVNDSNTNAGDTFRNEATYTYSGGTPLTSAPSAQLTIVEPSLAITKVVNNLTNPGNPAAGGDLLEYVVTLANSSTATAFDTTVTDTLPNGLALVAGSATAAINSVAVGGFNSNPTVNGADMVWGADNGDDSLDVPAGQSLALTYQVNVTDASVGQFDNSVRSDWTSMEGSNGLERVGDNCPAPTDHNDYCNGPVVATIAALDTTALAKTVLADTWDDAFSSANDGILRVGDYVEFALTLTLREGLTTAVEVTDTLPAGLVFDSVVAINGETSAPYSSVAPFTHTDIAAPAVVGNLITWSIGDITNAINNNATDDSFVIRYRARVANSTLAHTNSTALNNAAALNYDGGTVLNDSAEIEVRQPQIATVTKLDSLGNSYPSAAAPLAVDIANDVMSYELRACNAPTPAAPAYNLQLVDTLEQELDPGTISNVQVTINGAAATAGVDYNTALVSGGGVSASTMTFNLLAPVAAGQCATIRYEVGFYANLAPNQVWSNNVAATQYRSLPAPASDAEQYGAAGQMDFWMTNQVVDPLPVKTVVAPVAPDADVTIGEAVNYEITIAAINAGRTNLQITDSLPASLVYVDASAQVGGVVTALTDNSAGQDVDLTIAQVPAGEDVVVTLNTYVANSALTNAGDSIDNTASYTYGGYTGTPLTSEPAPTLTIVEPSLGIAKQVSNLSNPGAAPVAGDLLRYSITFTAAGGAANDEYSSAFDLTIDDALTLGLLYQPGSAAVDSGSVADPVSSGDGVTTPQTLVWSLADGSADIDVVEGGTVTLTYDVQVLAGVQAGQTLSNSATVQWTGIDGDVSVERDGSTAPAYNDYLAGPAIASLFTRLDVSLVKTVVNETSGQSPATEAEPGDVLRYSLTLTNNSVVAVSNAVFVDELAAEFEPGSLQLINPPAAADVSGTDAAGGAQGTGVVDIRGFILAAQGDAAGGDSVTLEYRARLASVLDSGTAVLNTGYLSGDNLAETPSNTTTTTVISAPQMTVEKTSADLTGDTAILQPGDRLRYTITVTNSGNENATDVTLKDLVPVFTTYVPGSTTLNGMAVSDVAAGQSPLQDGLSIQAAGTATVGVMKADGTTATVTFDVSINDGVVGGTAISNQGFVNGNGVGSGSFDETPSDDPSTPTINDPTVDVVGNAPLLDAHKTVALSVDNDLDGLVDPGDQLRYTIVISNQGSVDASGVSLVDTVPVNTTYVSNSVRLNNQPIGQPDGGVSPLIAGIDIASADGAASGVVSAGSSATVVFEVTVAGSVTPGTVISNQGVVSSTEQDDEPTDADGIDSNGDQPTLIVVGDVQLLTIVEEVFDVNGGVVLAGDELEFVVTVSNIGTLPATDVMISSDLSVPVANQLNFVSGFSTLNGSGNGVTFTDPTLSADYATRFGDLAAGATTVLRFRATADAALSSGTTLTNTSQVVWDSASQTESASASVVIGAPPGEAATVGGRVWHDVNYNLAADSNESLLDSWAVELYRNAVLLATTQTDANGVYQFVGLASNLSSSVQYSIRFIAPGAGVNTALLGVTDSPFVDALQFISGIQVGDNALFDNLNLPVLPNGVVYDSVSRIPVAGASLRMLNASTLQPLPDSCFDDAAQQGQVVAAQGYYRFDVNFSQSACTTANSYLLQVTAPTSDYEAGVSRLIPPQSDETMAAFDVPGCLGGTDDAVPATAELCEVVGLNTAPPLSVEARTSGTNYYLHLALNNSLVPGENQLFNNHIPLDPILDEAVAVRKVAGKLNVSRGDLVPYTITINNNYLAALQDLTLVDTFPAGFKYVQGSARFNGQALEPELLGGQLRWADLDLGLNSESKLELLFIPGAGVSEGEYINRAHVMSTLTNEAVSNTASATVRVVPDPTLDCSDIIGKVFEDTNLNGYPDSGERGIAGARVVSARGLLVTADEHGRFHLTCAAIPNEMRGSNFILKLDERSLPSGYRTTTENPRVVRLTRGKAGKFNFGATLHRVVRLDVAAGVFEPDSTVIRPQWLPRLPLLLNELQKAPSIVRVSYLADVESESLVKKRVAALKQAITDEWQEMDCCYKLNVETEIYWRRGAPPERSGVFE